ncbi:MAG: Uma2 family endonuclease [Chroococcus sp. CMT-3BRIN-NPC107]|jgi:Uma2 family endonuclease|nr:Uma2 family endonuclease [Chroococcus sp. CMT-3BRIN-NPC107]
MNWQEVCADKALQDIPYKIELNRWGQIVMSPAKNKHSIYQGLIQTIIQSMVKQGLTYPECPIQTEDNVKVADVVWISRKRYQQIKNDDVCSIAPEICIEIKSSSNTLEEMNLKKELYFKAGAEKFWLCNENGEVSFYSKDTQINHSAIVPNFPNSVQI